MFNIFKPRPPIIIINEATPAPPPAPPAEKKGWLVRNAVNIGLSATMINLVLLVVMVFLFARSDRNSNAANKLLEQQLEINTLLYRHAVKANSQDSVRYTRAVFVQDSIGREFLLNMEYNFNKLRNEQEKAFGRQLSTLKQITAKTFPISTGAIGKLKQGGGRLIK